MSDQFDLFNVKAKRKRREAVILYKRLFETEDGKKVLTDLVKCTPILTPSYSSDTHETAYNEGARSVVLRILRTLNVTETQMEELGRQVEETYEV